MKNKLKKLIKASIKESALMEEDSINSLKIEINQSTQSDHGDFSSNIALKISGKTNTKPIETAEIISKNVSFSKKADIYFRLKRLIDKIQMGLLFKVLFATKKINKNSILGF